MDYVEDHLVTLSIGVQASEQFEIFSTEQTREQWYSYSSGYLGLNEQQKDLALADQYEGWCMQSPTLLIYCILGRVEPASADHVTDHVLLCSVKL